MSSDFLEDVEDADGNSVMLTMRASGFLQLIVMAPDKEDEPGPIARFNLVPDATGLANAKNIAVALLEWREHMYRSGLVVGLNVPKSGTENEQG